MNYSHKVIGRLTAKTIPTVVTGVVLLPHSKPPATEDLFDLSYLGMDQPHIQTGFVLVDTEDRLVFQLRADQPGPPFVLTFEKLTFERLKEMKDFIYDGAGVVAECQRKTEEASTAAVQALYFDLFYDASWVDRQLELRDAGDSYTGG